MNSLFLTVQIILSVIIVACILLQARGTGFGTSWGGGGETYHTKRGVEKVVFYLTIVTVTLFTITSLAITVV